MPLSKIMISPIAETGAADEPKLTPDIALQMIGLIARNDPSYFHKVRGFIQQQDREKRELLQSRQNVTEELNEISEKLSGIETTISATKEHLQVLNGQRSALLRQKNKCLSNLETIHKTWISKYSATGNASL